MARGWESKDVEAQQREAEDRRRVPIAPPQTAEAAALAERRRGLELARAKVVADLAVATSPIHRSMLERCLAALDEELVGR